jgi:hypothetical protein
VSGLNALLCSAFSSSVLICLNLAGRRRQAIKEAKNSAGIGN